METLKDCKRVLATFLISVLLSQTTFAGTWWVDTNSDAAKEGGGCVEGETDNDNDCTFRNAIGSISASDTIRFLESVTITAGGPAYYPLADDGVTIDAVTGGMVVALDGGPGSENAIVVNGDNITVKGLYIYGFDEGSYAAIDVNNTANSVTLTQNVIGLKPGVATIDANKDGIIVDGSSVTISDNTISGNTNYGISMGVDAVDVLITGNKIGTNLAGTGSRANGYGIGIDAGTGGTADYNGGNGGIEGIVIGGDTSGERNIISGNTNSAFDVGNSGDTLSGNIIIQGNYIGTDASGTAAVANGFGISADLNADIEDIVWTIGTDGDGSNDATEGNVISGNSGTGVLIRDAGSLTIADNYIGVAADGTTALANSGIGIVAGGTNVTIGSNLDGTSDSLEGNTVGNNTNGISLQGSTMENVNIYGNYIGVNANGTGTHANTSSGININDASSDASTINIGGVGVTAASDGRNIISNNSGDGATGIGVAGIGPDSTLTIQNNYIGYEADGTTAAGNDIGIEIEGDSTTVIIGTDGDGSDDSDEGNLIGNSTDSSDGAGMLIGVGVSDFTIAGNTIGSNATHGIYVWEGSDLAGTSTMGGDLDVERNIITGNTGAGILISNSATVPFSIQNNYIGVASDGSTADGNGSDGVRIRTASTITMTDNVIANSTLNAVNILGGTALLMYGNKIGTTSAGTAPAGNTGSGVVVNASTIASVIIGGAAAALGNIFAASTGAAGIYIENLAANDTPVQIKGNYIGVCANLSTGSISSTNLATCKNTGTGVDLKQGSITIGGDNSIGAAGTGALAEGNVISNNYDGAVYVQNHASSPLQGVDQLTMYGNIIGLIKTTASGVFDTVAGNRILAGSSLFGAVDVESETINTFIFGGVGSIESSSKLNVLAATTGTAADGINLAQMGATGTATIQNNHIGTNWFGTTTRVRNVGVGINVQDGTINIGGTGSYEGNIIGANGANGIRINGVDASSVNNIFGNTIGLTVGESTAMGNSAHGIGISSTGANATINIGSSTSTDGRNYIGGNGGYGIMDSSASTYTLNVYGNYIGTDGTGLLDRGNTGPGIVITSPGVSANIGGGSSIYRNVIAGNDSYGIAVQGAASAIIRGNYIGIASDTTALANGTYEVVGNNSSGNISSLTVGGSEGGYGNTINNTAHIGVYLADIITSNESTIDSAVATDAGLDTDNTWTDTVGPFALTDPSYRFWSRSVGGEVANYGPKQCYDGVDNDDPADGLIDYGTTGTNDDGCDSYLDNDEALTSGGGSGGVSSGGSSSTNKTTTEETTTEEMTTEETTTEETTTEETTTEETTTEETTTEPTPREPVVVEVEDVKEIVEDGGSTTTETITGERQAEAKRESVIEVLLTVATDGGDETEELELEVVRTEEQEEVAQILSEVLDDSISMTEQEIEEMTVKLDVAVETEIARTLQELHGGGSSGGGSSSISQLVLKTGGIEKIITEDTEIITTLDASEAAELQAKAEEEGKDIIAIGPSTTPDVSDVSTLLILENGGDLSDELIDDKVFMKGLTGIASKATTIEEILPPYPIITNLDGATVGTQILPWTASDKVGDILVYYLIDRVDPEDSGTWVVEDIAEVVVGGDYKSAPLIDLRPYLDKNSDEVKELDLLVQNQEGKGKPARIFVDPTLEFEARELHLSRGEIVKITDPKNIESRRNTHNFSLTDSMKTSVLLASAHAAEEETGKDLLARPPDRQLTGYYDPGTTVFVTWKSVVLNSVVIADASQGYFEVDVPEDLEEGEHTVLVYAYNKKTNWISNVNSMLFAR